MFRRASWTLGRHGTSFQTHVPAGHFALRTRSVRVQDRLMRAPLLTERPYPLAEIVRRMVRIRCKFEDSEDFNERSLLRGEYKYYSGKTAEVRDADTSDMIALLDCYAFFEFWDNKLLSIVYAKLLERTSQLDTLELLLLYKALSKLEQTATDLYLDVCDRLCEMAASQLSLDETITLVQFAVSHTPQKLLHTAFFERILPSLKFVEIPIYGGAVLHGLTKLRLLPETVEEGRSEDDVRRGARHVLIEMGAAATELSNKDIALGLHSSAVLGVLDDQAVEGAVQDLIQQFVSRAKGTDPGAIALLLEGVTPLDPVIVLRLSDVLVAQCPFMTPTQSVACLESAVFLASTVDRMDAAAKRRAPAVEEIRALLSDVVRHHCENIKSTAHARRVDVLLRTLGVLALIDVSHRGSITAFNTCCQTVYSAVMAISPRFTASDCAQFLEICGSLRAAVSDTATKAVLDRIVDLSSIVSRQEAGDLLRKLHALPPLPTSAGRAQMQHVVLPAVLKRADGT